ncbi:hypothetical protein AWZ03_009846 [Drosophila navojoa]|uniref:Uncharacterized protein n=1 Tax=Drosophila navojoa TaxID=7232 RepID=A0A484B4U9_DRONA|nr:hypothetical protein AWZ03_009846 [Drosophila navojoa]
MAKRGTKFMANGQKEPQESKSWSVAFANGSSLKWLRVCFERATKTSLQQQQQQQQQLDQEDRQTAPELGTRAPCDVFGELLLPLPLPLPAFMSSH